MHGALPHGGTQRQGAGPRGAGAAVTAAGPGPVTEQRSRFRIVVGPDQQTFALRRCRGLVLISTVLAFILCDFSLLLLLIITIGGLIPGSGEPLAVGIVGVVGTPVAAYIMFRAHFRPPVVSITPNELRARGPSAGPRAPPGPRLHASSYGIGPTAGRC